MTSIKKINAVGSLRGIEVRRKTPGQIAARNAQHAARQAKNVERAAKWKAEKAAAAV